MFSHTFGRTVLAAAFAATLLVPAAQADSWARDGRAALDPAIATAIRDHATATPELDPAIATAIRAHAAMTPEPVALDPAIRTALLERASSPIRPDGRAGTRGVGSLPQPEREATSAALDWDLVSISAGAMFAALLLGFGSLLAIRHGRARVTNA